MEQLNVLTKQVNRNPSVVIGAIMIVTAIMFTILVTAPEAGDPSQSGFIPENGSSSSSALGSAAIAMAIPSSLK